MERDTQITHQIAEEILAEDPLGATALRSLENARGIPLRRWMKLDDEVGELRWIKPSEMNNYPLQSDLPEAINKALATLV